MGKYTFSLNHKIKKTLTRSIFEEERSKPANRLVRSRLAGLGLLEARQNPWRFSTAVDFWDCRVYGFRLPSTERGITRGAAPQSKPPKSACSHKLKTSTPPNLILEHYHQPTPHKPFLPSTDSTGQRVPRNLQTPTQRTPTCTRAQLFMNTSSYIVQYSCMHPRAHASRLARPQRAPERPVTSSGCWPTNL